MVRFKLEDCEHLNLTDVVKTSNVTCEEIETICDDCFKVLKKRIEC